MATELADLFIDINVRIDKLEADLKKAEGKASATGKKMESSFAGLGSSLKGLAAPLLALASFSGFAHLTREALEFGQATRDQARNLGLMTDELQFFQFTAVNAGVPVRQMEIAVQRLGRRLGEARQGIGESRQAFEQLGIIEDIDSGALTNVGDVVETVLERIQGMNDATERNALLMKLVDSEGVPAFNGMANAIQGAREQAENMNIVISEGTLAALESTNIGVNVFFKELETGFKNFIGKFAKGLIILDDAGKTTAEIVEEGSFANLLIRQEKLQADLETAQQLVAARQKAGEESAIATAQDVVSFFKGETPEEAVARLQAELETINPSLEEFKANLTSSFEGVDTDAGKLAVATQQIEKLKDSLKLDEAFQAGGDQAKFEESLAQGIERIKELGSQSNATEVEIQSLIDRFTAVEQAKFDKTLADKAGEIFGEAGEFTQNIQASLNSFDALLAKFEEIPEGAEGVREALETVAIDEFFGSLADGVETVEQFQVMLARLRVEFLALGEAGKIGAEDLDNFLSRLDALSEDPPDFAKKTTDDVKSFAEVADDSFDSVGNSFGDMLGDMVFQADQSFNQILASFGRMIAEMTARKFIAAGVDTALSAISFASPVSAAGAAAPPANAVVNILSAPGTEASARASSNGVSNEIEVMIENTVVKSITSRGAAGQAIESTFNLGNPGQPGGRL